MEGVCCVYLLARPVRSVLLLTVVTRAADFGVFSSLLSIQRCRLTQAISFHLPLASFALSGMVA